MWRAECVQEVILLQRGVALRQRPVALAIRVLMHTQGQDASSRRAQFVNHSVASGGAHGATLGISPHRTAAELLDLPFSTYRRHLSAGVARVAEILWTRDIGSGSAR